MFSSIPKSKTQQLHSSVNKNRVTNCKAQQSQQPAVTQFERRPKTLTCSICGREFGQSSLEIHQKTCIKKYQNELLNLPKDFKKIMPSTQQMMQKVEQERLYRQSQGRPQSGINQPSRAGKGGGYDYSMLQQAPTQFIALAPCRRCGRKFNPDRIMKHESVCIGPAPDIQGLKQKQLEMNQRAARKMRPKQTGVWKQQHQELQAALKNMRRQTLLERQGISSNKGRKIVQSNKFQQPPKPQDRFAQQQPVRINNQQLGRPLSAKPVKKSYGGGFSNQAYGREPYQPPKGSSGGGGNYQIANSNVSTFSLFTQDGRPKDYTKFQSQNPVPKKGQFF